ncbi:MAG: magnesium transporter CorA family protein [Gammaproteobacteria bacterium]|nr:magnesium transporter CorA family protein [Gammaproteobacteria bacterium]MBV9697655.1 magnesium transporter CorA family protein [Gammaproteobacteria bacterium]
MLSAYLPAAHGLERQEVHGELPAGALWFDLLQPSAAEEHAIEQALRIDVPTPEEMRAIETSNRLYEEEGALYLTATVLFRADTDRPETTQVTFILTPGALVTSRYNDLRSFKDFSAYAATHATACATPLQLLVGLLNAIVNRLADGLERVGADIDATSLQVFPRGRSARTRGRNYQGELQQIGASGDVVSRARESLVSLSRLLAFLQESDGARITPEARASLRTVTRDVTALSDHATFLVGKAQFLLDATLGLVTIDQNNILKIFSLLAVLLLPPSLIAGFFGMNFAYVPWLHAPWGVWAAIALMLATGLAPFFYFKRKGWL